MDDVQTYHLKNDPSLDGYQRNKSSRKFYSDKSDHHMVMDVGRAAHTMTKALDYVGINDKSHGRRVGLMCHRIAHILGWDQKRRHDVLLAGMLHDCGVSSTALHKKLTNEIEWEGCHEHCERGEFFLNNFEPFESYSLPVKYHHTRWVNLPLVLTDKEKENANLIFLSDRLDVVYNKFLNEQSVHSVLNSKNAILGKLSKYVGILFAPHLFEAAKEAIQKDSFWFELRDEYLDDVIFETLNFRDYKITLNFDEVESMGELISLIVDAKSPFTHHHSLRVADISYSLSGLMGFTRKDRRLLRIAALLHDVGKLKTPDEILEKPTNLTQEEFSQMRCHPLDTKIVLRAIFPKTPIAKWASEHHEKIDGSGYPYGWQGDQIDLPTRILAISDIFQALCQKRPYRDMLKLNEVISIMDDMENEGQIDSQVYAILKSNGPEYYKIAIRDHD